MSNTTCHPRGIAKRALALLTAIALATTLTPNFAFAGEANNSASITAEQSSTAGSTGSLSADDATANKADATPDVSESQASGSDSAAGHAAASNSKANAGELTDPSNANKVPSIREQCQARKSGIQHQGRYRFSNAEDLGLRHHLGFAHLHH